MAIPLGQKQITIEDKFELISACIFGLDTPSGKRLSINYYVGGEEKTLELSGQDWNNFVTGLPGYGKPILNLIKSREEGIANLVIDDQTIQNQFLNELEG